MKEVVVILDNVRSALNVGAIFRTCDGAGVSKLLLGGITPYPPHPRVIKTAIGAEESVNFLYARNLSTEIKKLKDLGFQIISIEQTEKSKNFFEVKLKDKIALIFGNELTGVSRELINMSDLILELPMRGVKNSLNVSTTVGIVLYNTIFSQ